MTEEKKKSLHPISRILCELYESLARKEGILFPLNEEQINKLDSIAKTVLFQYGGFVRFPGIRTRAAAYFVLIIKDHPVTDGNKRLAVMFLELYCLSLGLKMSLHVGESTAITLDQLAVAIEKTKGDIDTLIEYTKIILFY